MRSKDLLWVGAAMVLGCSSAASGAEDATAHSCTPGVQASCACAGGRPSGVQVCSANGGGYGSCTGCSANEAGGGIGDASIAKDAQSPDSDGPAAGDGGAWLLDAGVGDAGGCPGLDPSVDVNQNGVPDCIENMLQNGQFATVVGTAPWSASVPLVTGSATITFSPTDEHGLPGSGSAVIVANVPSKMQTGGGSIASECVPVQPGGTYSAYSRYVMPSGQPGGDGSATTWITIPEYSDGLCAVGYAEISGGTFGTAKDIWATYARKFTADVSVHSVRVVLSVDKGATASDVQATFDNVLLVREPSDAGVVPDASHDATVVDSAKGDALEGKVDGAGDGKADATDAGCSIGALGCDGQQPQTCTGVGGWQNVGAPCSGSTPTCLAGACVPCAPMSSKCSVDGGVDAGVGIETCTSSGQWGITAHCAQPSPACTEGTAGPSCVCSTATVCAGVCVNEQVDVSNCGGCGVKCAAGGICLTGLCYCPEPEVICGGSPGVCVNELTDTKNCGRCGTNCDLCVQGKCIASSIPTACAQADNNVGCCGPDGRNYYCSSGSTTVTSSGCVGGQVCGWSASKGDYVCTSTPQLADPSGTYSIACQ